MSTVAINLPESAVNRVMARTGKRTARSAVLAALKSSGNIPNAETARALRSKAKGKLLSTRKDFKNYLDTLA